MPMFGQLERPIVVAVENHQSAGSGIGEILERFLGHLSGADHEHAFVVELLEDPRGEIGDRHAGNAHAVAVERGVAGDAAGDPQRGLKQMVHQRPGAADPPGELVGLLHLAEDLGFAEDHAVEAGGDGEQMSHDLGIFEGDEIAADVVDRHVVEIGQVGERRFDAGGGIVGVGGGVELDTIASREEHGLGLGMAHAPGGERVGRLGRAEGEPLPGREAAMPVAASDHREFDRGFHAIRVTAGQARRLTSPQQLVRRFLIVRGLNRPARGPAQ